MTLTRKALAAATLSVWFWVLAYILVLTWR
jgi:hypothetical protein